ncbi:hypothetical protein AB0J86_34290 [Micromonospora sp. NPDC049559]|uniref:hypothetical protein n=1 Tax=Micromonospora sp. NPDC049559 TaxID=3155923 RepID=UPI0034130FE6
MTDFPATNRRLSRRTLMAITGAGAAATAAGAAVPGAARGARRGGDGAPNARPLADPVLAAFARHRIVAIGEIHGQQAHHDALVALLTDPRLPMVVDDIVVEFGNALHQPLVDRFVAGSPVEDRDLRTVWRDTTQSPVSTWDAPMYEQFFRTVRAVNWSLPPGRRMRVLLGDPPVDWSRVRTPDDLAPFEDRDGHLVAVLRREVLDRGRRALVCYGSNHVKHAPPGAQGGGGIAHLEAETGQRAYVVLAGGHPRLASSRRPAILPVAGSWLESADSAEFQYLPGRCGVPLGGLADALLYLGQVGEQTASLWNPAIYLDPGYWAELQRRNAIVGDPVDLEQRYRREQSVVWPTPGPSDC